VLEKGSWRIYKRKSS